MFRLTKHTFEKLRLSIIPLDDFNSNYRLDCLLNPLREDKGKLDVLITDLENFLHILNCFPFPPASAFCMKIIIFQTLQICKS